MRKLAALSFVLMTACGGHKPATKDTTKTDTAKTDTGKTPPAAKGELYDRLGGRPAMVTAAKRPTGETRGKVAAGPDAGQRHRASPRPYVNGLLTAGVAHKKSAFELGGLGLSRVLSAPVREALSR